MTAILLMSALLLAANPVILEWDYPAEELHRVGYFEVEALVAGAPLGHSGGFTSANLRRWTAPQTLPDNVDQFRVRALSPDGNQVSEWAYVDRTSSPEPTPVPEPVPIPEPVEPAPDPIESVPAPSVVNVRVVANEDGTVDVIITYKNVKVENAE